VVKYQSTLGINYTDQKMEPNDYVVNIGDIDVSSYTLSNDTITISTSKSYDYNIDWAKIDILKSNRSDIKDEGKIPVDIWARMYNNGKIND